MTDNFLHAELIDLAFAVCDGAATDEQIDRIETILAADPDARLLYLQCLELHFEIDRREGVTHNEHRETSTPQRGLGTSVPSGATITFPIASLPISHPSAPLFTTHSMLFSYLMATVVLGTALAIAWVWKLPAPVQVVRQSVPLPSPHVPLHSFVGRITGMIDCDFSDASTMTFAGSSVPLGRKYALSSGLMEITYDTGAKVILQGPATYEVESAAGGYLSVGKLTARVEKKAENGKRKTEDSNPQSPIPNPSLSTAHYPLFTIKTPTAVVTDLGTEFGVEVRESGATSASVFRGVVEVQLIARDGQRGQVVRLTENESAHVEASNDGEHLTLRCSVADPTVFVRSEQIPKLAEDLRLKSFHRWQAYSDELRKDTSLLAYYDFQQKEGTPAVLPNVADNGKGSFDGAVANATWTTGRMPGKQALLFRDPQDYVRIDLPQETNDLTLAIWICFDSFHQGVSSALLMSEGWSNVGQVHWQVDNSTGQFVFSTTSVSESYLATVGSAKSWVAVNSRQFHKWMHLVSVYDRQAERVRFYVNGRSLSEADYGTAFPIAIGPARIGGWDSQDRNVLGRIDELAVFGRILGADEVRRMYEQGKP